MLSVEKPIHYTTEESKAIKIECKKHVGDGI
jgi:hypothetical protein